LTSPGTPNIENLGQPRPQRIAMPRFNAGLGHNIDAIREEKRIKKSDAHLFYRHQDRPSLQILNTLNGLVKTGLLFDPSRAMLVQSHRA
jgi:hypothetical protein